MPRVWLRHEVKADEHRAALTPSVCADLIQQGFEISVEKSTERCFSDEEYEKVGCTLVPTEGWKTAPNDFYIVGLKELEEDTFPLIHSHIYFGHCYKGQVGSESLMSRFVKGKGTLLDLEFLTDESKRRVAAFGYHAGYAGAALGLDLWAHRHLNSGLKASPTKYPSVLPFKDEAALLQHLATKITAAVESSADKALPRVHVMGALGRCGSGAIDLLVKANIPEENIIRWDMKETAKGGPFPEIMESDIFVNCIYLFNPIPPFLNKETISQPGKLSIIVDVSCDITNPHNPLPIYNTSTTFKEPIVSIPKAEGSNEFIDIIAIDHLPSLLPRESSDRFSKDLYPSFVQLKDFENARVWQDVVQLFNTKAKELNLV